MSEDDLIIWESGKRKHEKLRASTNYGHLSIRLWEGKYRGVASLGKTEHSSIVWITAPKDTLFDIMGRVREMHAYIQEHIVQESQ